MTNSCTWSYHYKQASLSRKSFTFTQFYNLYSYVKMKTALMCSIVKIKWMPRQDLHFSFYVRVTFFNLPHLLSHDNIVHITSAQGLHCFAKASVLCVCMYACIPVYVCSCVCGAKCCCSGAFCFWDWVSLALGLLISWLTGQWALKIWLSLPPWH